MKKRRSTILALLLLVMGWQAAMAQTITGKVVDKEGKALQYVNCVLRSLTDSAYLGGSVTQADGTFSLTKPEAECVLHLSMMGYASQDIACDKEDLGTITLQPDTMTLSEVVVKGERPLLTMVNNTLTYNVEGILQKRNITNAHELLKELPSVLSLDGESLDLVGAQTTTVFISGKQKPMTLDYLKSLPADEVEKVEVIYNAPPEWHVDGAVLNVVLKRKDSYTLNGMLQAGYSNQHANSYNGGASLFASTPKWSYNLIYKYSNWRDVNQNTTESHHTLEGTIYDIYSETNGKSKGQGHDVFANISRKVGKDGDISLAYSGRLSPDGKSTSIGDNSYFGISTSNSEDKSYMHDIHLSYTNGKGIKAGVEYMNYYDRGPQWLRVTDPNGEETSNLDYDANQRVSQWKAYVDMNHKLGHGWQLGYGANYMYTNNKNRQTLETDLGNMESGKSESKLEEHKAQVYATIRKSLWDNKLSLAASLKEEYYKANEYKKNALLPVAQITWVPSGNHILQFIYGMMRNYPSYWQTRDFASYTDAYTREEGNSSLKPSMLHNARVLYVLKGKYTVWLNYTKIKDHILYQGYQSDESLALIYQPQNINYAQTVDMGVTIPLSVCKWWDLDATLSGSWQDFKADNWNGHYFNRHKWLGMATFNNTFTLSNKPKLQANINGFYRTGPLQGVLDYDQNGGVSASLRLTFLKDNATLSVGCEDIFQTYYADFHQRLDNQDLTFNLGRHVSRNIHVSFTYKINGYKERSHHEVDTSRLGM